MKNLLKVKEPVNCAGVYCLKNTETDKILLVGSGIECNDRLSWYIYHLKRNLFVDTNKEPLQEVYDRCNLAFEMLHISEYSNKVKDMSDDEKKSLQEALSVLEKTYIDLYKDTILNKQMTVKKHSSNKSKVTSYKRSLINRGSKNPHAIYNEQIVREILWLRMNTDMKPKEIIKHYDGLIKQGYISRIGLDRYIYLEPIQPEWYEKEKVVPTAIDTTVPNTFDSVEI